MDEALVANRIHKVTVIGRAHAMAADMYEKRHRMISIPIIVMSTLVAGTAVAALGDFGKAKFWLDVAICVCSLLVAVLTALQSFLDYSSRAKKHALAAARLFALGRRWERRGAYAKEAEIGALDGELADIMENQPRVSIELQQMAHRAVDKEIAAAAVATGGGGGLVGARFVAMYQAPIEKDF